MRSRKVEIVAVLAMLCAPKPVRSQAAAPASPQAGFEDGFFIQTADGDTRLTFGMVAQIDGRFSLDNPQPFTDTFTVRKARPTVTGQIRKYFDFKFNPDFGNGTVSLEDLYLDIKFSPKFRVRSGKDKVPVGYELLIGDAYVLFPERSLASSLVPNRDIGFQVQGDLATSRLSYAAGVFNGVADGASSTTEIDANNAKDLAGRIIVSPWLSTQSPGGPLGGLGFHLGGSIGREAGALPVFRTSAQQIYFSPNPTAAASGVRSRVTPAVFYYYKSFGGYAEYVRSAQRIARDGVQTHVVNDAWEATASYLLTGEAASAGIVRPRDDFDPENGHWGAVQLLARYAALTVDPRAFTAGLAEIGSSQRTKSLALGVNWYPNAYVKLYATFERTMFDGEFSGGRPTEHVVIFRTQLGF
jgi:phosphate-selective porin OprO/OprP